MVALDPRLSETAAKADEWIGIRPGTDLDFMLAMLKVMMEEGYYDSEFLRLHSNMPFLLYRDEAGEWRLANDAEGNPRVVAEGGSTIHTLPAFTNNNATDTDGQGLYPALEAPEGLQLDGRSVVTVFQAQLDELKDNTPEWAAVTTGVAAETIRRIARGFGTTRPAVVDPAALLPLWQHHDVTPGPGRDPGPRRRYRQGRWLDHERRVPPQGLRDVQGQGGRAIPRAPRWSP